MKVKFSQRLSTRIAFMPMLFVLTIFIAGGGFFYLSNYRHIVEDLPKSHLMEISSEKRLSFRLWMDNYRRELDNLSRLDAIRTHALTIIGIEPSLKGRKRIAAAINQAQASLVKLMNDETQSGRYKMCAVVARDGRVIAANAQEIIGEVWSDRTFIKNIPSEKTTTVIGIGAEGRDYGVRFLTPVFDMQGNVMALIYAVAVLDDAANILGIEKAVYKSEKIEVIDSNGNVVLTKDGVPSKMMRYNIPNDSKDMVGYKDGIFFYTTEIENTPLRLISTTAVSELKRPLDILFSIYFLMLGVVVIAMIIQNSYVKNAVARPIAKLINAIRAFAMGNNDIIAIGKGYKGEMLELKNSLEHMIEELKQRESLIRDEISEKEKNSSKSSLFSAASRNMQRHLIDITKGLETVLADDKAVSETGRKAIEATIALTNNILEATNILLALSTIEDKNLALSTEDFDMRYLMNEIEQDMIHFIGLKEIEMVFDCDAFFDNNMVHADRQHLKQIITNLVINAVRCTDVGTITVLASKETKDNIEYLELSVADTGKGIESKMGDAIFDEFSEACEGLELVISKKLVDYMGGSIIFESIPGKGSVFTITIPITTHSLSSAKSSAQNGSIE